MQKKQIRREVKHRMKEGLEKNDLVLLRFSQKDAGILLNWKHAGEFEYEGRMYDIIRQESRNDTTYYWCWLDGEETDLNHRLRELTALVLGEDPGNQERQTHLIDFYKSLFHSTGTDWLSPDLPGMAVRLPGDALHASLCLPPPGPPPRIA